MDLRIERLEQGDAVDLVVAGRLDAETSAELERAVSEELRRGLHAIRIDLDAVTFLSSAGIRGLFETHRTAQAAGAACVISRASPTVRKVLDLTRLTPILMGTGEPGRGTGRPPAAAVEELRIGAVRLVALERPTTSVGGERIGSAAEAFAGRGPADARRRLDRDAFALGIGAIADDAAAAERAGELAVACGTAFHRPPHPHAAVDYMVPSGDLLASVDVVLGLAWRGLPSGRTGFEPADDEAAVSLDELATRLLDVSAAEAIALVVAGEVRGLVGAELIRPLAAASADDSPQAGTRDVAARWLSFSREPVFPRHTALVVGVACRPAAAALDGFVRPLPGCEARGHFHAVVFPYRPLRRGPADLAATVSDLARSIPVALVHLLSDPQPVLGSGRSELVRGAAWFAPLDLASGGARR